MPKFKTTRPIHGLTGKGCILQTGAVIELPEDHPDIPQFTELGYLIPTDESPVLDESPTDMTEESDSVDMVKPKAKRKK